MKTFQEMPLALELQKALQQLQFSEPTEIQRAVIPVAMKRVDLMACAETGSGKTAAYGIPMVSQLLEEENTQALIMAPTRELVYQIADFLRNLTAHCKNLKISPLVGGADMRKQFMSLKRNPRIIVATPGRLIDHLSRGSLRLDKTSMLILDEGDRMLDMGFAPQLEEVLRYLPQQRQTSLFTATLPEKVRRLAEKYLQNPTKINVGRVSLPVASIKQHVVQVTAKEKNNRIVDELNQRQGSVIIFARTKQRTDSLAQVLMDYGFSVDLIHGGRTQGQRNRAIQNFRTGASRILCATDIAARGIDVPQVEHVINFDLPMMDEDYVHRIGRTARNGAKGEAVSFVTPEEHRTWMVLTKKYKIQGVDLKGVTPGFAREFSKGKKGKKPNRSRFDRFEREAPRDASENRSSRGRFDRSEREAPRDGTEKRSSRGRFDRFEREAPRGASETRSSRGRFDRFEREAPRDATESRAPRSPRFGKFASKKRFSKPKSFQSAH